MPEIERTSVNGLLRLRNVRNNTTGYCQDKANNVAKRNRDKSDSVM